MPIRLSYPPAKDALMSSTTGKRHLIAELWERWFTSLVDSVTSRVQVLSVVTLRSLMAAVSLTDIQTSEPLPNGLYRATVTVLPYQGLSATSSIDVTIEWTTEGASWGATLVTRVFADGFAAGTGTVLMNVDAGTPVQYRINHNAGTDINPYAAHVDIVLERIR